MHEEVRLFNGQQMNELNNKYLHQFHSLWKEELRFKFVEIVVVQIFICIFAAGSQHYLI